MVPASYLSTKTLPYGARRVKLAVDLLVGALFFVPLVLLVTVNGVYCLLNGGGLPLVSEPRMGRNGSFKFYKLRVRSRKGQPTRFGEFLRRWGIDEIGQVLNILKRDMSLVGPRPVTPEQHGRYIEIDSRFTQRYGALPGLLGLGIGTVTNRLCVQQEVQDTGLLRLEYDLSYAQEWSWRLEFKAIRVSLVDIVHGHDPS
ncbi:MAG TPA: sugar transferase [Candidatus Chromulinivoraceae bacterium]|nr:sugar transferase [Candidatus Chromulinivoraceae bacterium]